MSKLFPAVFLLVIGSLASASVHNIKMNSIGYDPKKIEIRSGDSVEWTNAAYTEHSATFSDTAEKYDTGLIQPKKTSKKIEFSRAGNFPYHCSVHGKTMSGEIVVKP